MKGLIVFLLLMLVMSGTTVVYADEPEPAAVPAESEIIYYDVNAVINNPDSTEKDFLKAILICVRDINMYLQFFVTMVFAIGLCWFFILRPITYFFI